MEVDSKDSEIEQLNQKLASASADTVSNISSGAENDSEEGVQVINSLRCSCIQQNSNKPASCQFELGFMVGRMAFCTLQAEHSSSWLAEAVRRRVIEKDLLL